METISAIAKWMESSNGVMTWLASFLTIAVIVWSWRLSLAKLKGVHKLPVVRATVGTTWKIAACAAVSILVDRGVARKAALADHDAVNIVSTVETVQEPEAKQDSEPAKKALDAKGAERSVVRRDDAVAPTAHAVAKPIIVNGKASHSNQSFSQFKPAEIEGYVRCKTCNQLGSFVQVGRRWQFVEAELAPEPIFMR